MINKILKRFLETYPEYDTEEYSIGIYKSRERMTTNNIDVYNIQVSNSGYAYYEDGSIVSMYIARVCEDNILSIKMDYCFW
jgi:uncharacterized protein (UPF0248 family)